jgi:mannosyl-3-phosphoglycerate synthase
VKLEMHRNVEMFGAVRINDVQRIFEIGPGNAEEDVVEGEIITPSAHRISDILGRMAIIVPIKGENLKLLEGILASIPTRCLVLVLSNSDRKPIDRYKMEAEAVANFCRASKHSCITIHQKDAKIAAALKDAGYSTLLDGYGRVRNGKGEAMVLGIIFAKLFKRQYVGFIDADNFVPSTAYEYIQSFAAGFSMAKTPYSMVRISWRYKPKISAGGLYFRRRGRVSEITNRILNLVISDFTGFGSEIIKTGNAGEHAISLPLAEILQFASRFAIEPYELVNMLEIFGRGEAPEFKKSVKEGVEVLQIESRSPHFHDNKGEEHLNEMLLEGLASVYHSNICSDRVKQEIVSELLSRKAISSADDVGKPRVMDPLSKIDFEAFHSRMRLKTDTIQTFNLNNEVLNLPDMGAQG